MNIYEILKIIILIIIAYNLKEGFKLISKALNSNNLNEK